MWHLVRKTIFFFGSPMRISGATFLERIYIFFQKARFDLLLRTLLRMEVFWENVHACVYQLSFREMKSHIFHFCLEIYNKELMFQGFKYNDQAALISHLTQAAVS